MSKRSRPFMKYFLIFMAVYFVMGLGFGVQLWIQFPKLLAEGEVSVGGISGDKEAIDLVMQNQEKIPGYMRLYVQGVASYKAEKILKDVFQFMKKWVSAVMALNLLMGMIILIWAKNLYERIYNDALEARRRR